VLAAHVGKHQDWAPEAVETGMAPGLAFPRGVEPTVSLLLQSAV